MLILANGAYKCGSGWQNRILHELVPSEPIPKRFQHPKWSNPSFHPRRLPEFLSLEEHVEKNFVSKNHIRDAKLARLLIDDPNVYVFNLTRDLRDVLVSAYHHDQRHGQYVDIGIEQYYWEIGRSRVDAVLRYHRFWNVGHGGVFVGSYEGLHANFDAQVRAMASFLGLDVDDERIASVRENTAFDKAKKTGPGAHRRKGIVGDWQGTLSQEILEDMRLRLTDLSRKRPARKARDRNERAQGKPTRARS